jgi:hypothetical protein
MSRTRRRSRAHGEKIADREASKFCHHDITPILKGMRQSQKAEDKAYFKKYGDTKYKQKPKSRGSSW